jgi:hypothetical protein
MQNEVSTNLTYNLQLFEDHLFTFAKYKEYRVIDTTSTSDCRIDHELDILEGIYNCITERQFSGDVKEKDAKMWGLVNQVRIKFNAG